MRNVTRLALVIGATAMLSACGGGMMAARDRPDEFAVQRQAPLVIPPDFELMPPLPAHRVRPTALPRSKRSMPCSPPLRAAQWKPARSIGQATPK